MYQSFPKRSTTSAARNGVSGGRAHSRRSFLKSAATGIAVPYFVPSSVFAAPGQPGANDRLRIGVIGAGNRVSWLFRVWGDPQQFRLAAVTDCYAKKLSAFVNTVKGKFTEAENCPTYEDYREMLDKEQLDGVFVTTPAHGRVLPCIHACQAGVDIYAEKPVTLTIAEGQTIVQAVKKYDRIFQSGTQARSISVNCWAVDQLHKGAIGNIQKVKAPNFNGPINYKPRATPDDVPAGLNWDLWCNQAPLFPCDLSIAERLEDGWAPYREFDGGGDRWGMTGFGVHAYDQILWAIGKDTESPVEAWPTRPGDLTSPVTMRFSDGVEIEMFDQPGEGPAFGGIIFGSEGKMEINRGRVATNPADVSAALPKFSSPDQHGINHVQNWIDSIRSRKATRCPIEVAHRQSVICHIANVVRDLGQRLRYDPKLDRFVDDAKANSHPSVGRSRRAGYELPDRI